MNSCIVCGGTMEPRKEWLRKCASCGFLFSNLRAGAGTGIDGLDNLRRLNFETLLDRLEKFGPVRGKRILEPGSSAGLFLEAAARRGGVVTGLEPEQEKAGAARARGFKVLDGFFPDALSADEKFDVIVFNDVFEHLPDPAASARACAAHLAEGGILAINLPDSGGTLYKVAGLLDRFGDSGPFERLWQKDFPSPHVSYFNRKNLQRLIEKETPLRRIDAGALQTIEASGLKDRIFSSRKGPAGWLMYAGLTAFLPLQKALPPDIQFQFFRQPS